MPRIAHPFMTGRPPSTRHRARGLTLVELMVALTLGLVLLAALITLFVNTSGARRELDRSAELQESGRYALEFLRDELAHAGFYGPLVSVSGTVDEPCSTDIAKWRDSLALHVRGSNQDDATTLFSCLGSARKAGTDAVFIQRAATCTAGATGCDGLIEGVPYLQVSGCGDEYSTTPFVAEVATTSEEASPFTLRTKECVVSKTAPVRRFIRRIFYVGTDDALYHVDVGIGGVGEPVFVTSGVEDLQFEYALDSDGNGSPDTYESDPAAWADVVGVRLWVLARSEEQGARAEGKRFDMGDVSVTPADTDRYKRHVFSSFVTFITPQGIRE